MPVEKTNQDVARELNEDLERRVALRTEELSRINEELRASEARYRDVVETQTEFIVRWRADGTRTFVNEAFCRFRGSSAEDLIGRSFLPLIHPDDLHLFEEAMAKISPAHPSATLEVRNIREDGTWSWLQWSHRAFFDAAGDVSEYQSVGRDVTELKRAADLLRQKEDHLAHLARVSTLGEMVAGIVHEVSQPLHAAKTFAQAARRHLQSGRPGGVETAIECTDEISDAVARTGQIIRRLREFAKSRSARLEVLALNAVVRDALELMAYEIRRVGASLRVELVEPSPSIKGDRVQLEQLCVNLLKNACEAMDQTPPDARVLQVQTFLCDGRLCMAVRDTGCGIQRADADRLFEAFYSTKDHGMGMGLSLCKSIADAHGIEMSFADHGEEPGTTFRLAMRPVDEAVA